MGLLEPLGELDRGLLAPCLEDAAQERLAITEVPIEAAPRHLELAGEDVDTDVIDPLIDEHLGGFPGPIFRRQRGPL